LAKLRARLQSATCAASRASLMKPRILETRSDCAAFRVFPRVDSRFFSAMPKLWVVCCWATADSCGVNCGAINGGCNFSASVPPVVDGGVLARGRGGAVRTGMKWPGNGGKSSRSSGPKSSDAKSPIAVRACTTGFTCTAVAQGIFGRFFIAHPPSANVAQQRSTTFERRERCNNTNRDRTGFSVIFRPRVAVRFGTSCPGRPPK
jgi:hypothetical protein